MKRINLKAVVDRIGNYYEATIVAAKRAKSLYAEDSYTFGKDENGKEHKKTVIAMLEILSGKVCAKENE